jgi:hypothetical protein
MTTYRNSNRNLTASTKVVAVPGRRNPYRPGSAGYKRIERLMNAVAMTNYPWRRVGTLRDLRGLKTTTVSTAYRHGLLKIAA